MPMVWTPELDEKLEKMYLNNLSREDIASQLNTTVCSVAHRVDKLGLIRKNTNYIEFSDEQVVEILSRYPTDSIRKIANDFNVSTAVIKRVLDKNGVNTSSYRWSSLEIDKLSELCKDHTLDEIALELERTPTAVYTKAKHLGLTLYKHRREWTEAEDNFLIEHWGMRKLSYISNYLNRSDEACILRAKKLGLGGALENTEYVLLAEFCRAIKISKETVLRRWVPLGFKIKQLKLTKERIFNAVNLEKALGWMKEHQTIFNGYIVEEMFFVPEPKWLKDKRIRDRSDTDYLEGGKPREYWSKLDEERLRGFLKLGKTHEEIAVELNKSKSAISYKVGQLNLGYRAKKFWSGAEFKFIREHWKTMTDTEMANELNRPVRSVESHRLQMGLKRKQIGI